MLLPSCHHILEEVPEEPPYRLTGKLHCTHYAQIYCCHFRTRITSVVLYSFSQRCKWADLTFGQVVVYRISSIPAVHEQAFLEVVEVVKSLVHEITIRRSMSERGNTFDGCISIVIIIAVTLMI